jgi:hypothetical protein
MHLPFTCIGIDINIGNLYRKYRLLAKKKRKEKENAYKQQTEQIGNSSNDPLNFVISSIIKEYNISSNITAS